MKELKRKVKNVWFLIHAGFFVLMISGIFWMNWFGMLAIFLALRVQDFVLGGCVLTKLEHGSYERRFTKIHTEKFFGNWALKYYTFVVDWFLPGIAVYLAYIYQK
jgi:hypothetical protein